MNDLQQRLLVGEVIGNLIFVVIPLVLLILLVLKEIRRIVREELERALSERKGRGEECDRRRDYFAGCALQGLLACPDSEGSRFDYARMAIGFADALIASLDAKQGE